MLDRVQLDLDAEISNAGFRPDECPPDIVITNQTECERNPALLGKTNGRSHARVRDRHHKIGFYRIFQCQDTSHHVAALLNGPTEHDAIRTREIYVFEDAF